MKISALLLACVLSFGNVNIQNVSENISFTLYSPTFYDIQTWISDNVTHDSLFDYISCQRLTISNNSKNGTTILSESIYHGNVFDKRSEVYKSEEYISGTGLTLNVIKKIADSHYWEKLLSEHHVVSHFEDVKVYFYAGYYAFIKTDEDIYCTRLEFTNHEVSSQDWMTASNMLNSYQFMPCEVYIDGEKSDIHSAIVNKDYLLFSTTGCQRQ